MPHIGIDIEQFATDPQGSGIQRVLQYLAKKWPQDVSADFVVPLGSEFALLSPAQAADLISIAFEPNPHDDLRHRVTQRLAELRVEVPRVKQGQLISIFSSWLLPEVSYLPSVLHRMELIARTMPTAMIGYDALPMTEPANYRFTPGNAAYVSEYFRLLARADSVVCISRYARDSIWERLRRPRCLPISIAHPGGDHVPADVIAMAQRIKAARPANRPVRFLRLGTLEARKQPREILRAFEAALGQGANLELTFMGNPSASDASINDELAAAAQPDGPIRWITGASDEQVWQQMAEADVFLSLGTEGYGIPVLEAIALGTPVLYSGIQPAAEIMEGRGARNIGAANMDLRALDLANIDLSKVIEDSRDTLPKWRTFSQLVAEAAS